MSHDYLLGSVEAQGDLFRICLKLVEYMHFHAIRNLVALDRSSRPLYVGFLECWRWRFPNERPPCVFFVNPTGFNSWEYKEDLNISSAFFKELRNQKEIEDDFCSSYPHLYRHREEPVLVFDTCIHSGDSLRPVLRCLDRLGFTKVRVGAVEARYGASHNIRVDFSALEYHPDMGCYPFGRDYMIKKHFSSVYSKVEERQEAREVSKELRRAIRQVIRKQIRLRS